MGPTGSGKTTTLHSLLGHINKPERKIWTAEDPVEITQYGLRQVQVHAEDRLHFATAMRAFLRADPDVIMVGEMRDEETASTGIEASLTGHLVSQHAAHEQRGGDRRAPARHGAATRSTSPTRCSASWRSGSSSASARTARSDYHPERAEYDELAQAFGEEEFPKLNLKYDESFVLYRGKGCAACDKTGYRGRAGIHELLIATDEMKRLIQTKARVAEMFEMAKSEGMTTLVQDGMLKTLTGLTDFRQVKAVAIK